MKTVSVILRNEDAQHYDILVAEGLLSVVGEKLKPVLKDARMVIVVTDNTVRDLHLRTVYNSLCDQGFKTICYSVSPGEKAKKFDSYFTLINWLADGELTRTDAIVALGGGVVGDLTGFAAATYLRGIPYVQIPTTLLAMVDSSVGGKTAIDLFAGKNLVGAFYQPSLVLCDTNALATLPEKVLSDGFAEVIKYGMIRREDLLEMLLDPSVKERLADIIEICVSVKRDIVQEDVFDTGERRLLNFGHTIGHAIERLSRYEISHGQAAAIGMSIITRASVRKNICPPECQTTLERLLELFNLPNRTEYTPRALYEAALNDKKRSGGFITEIVPVSAGKCELRKMPVDELLEWIELGAAP